MIVDAHMHIGVWDHPDFLGRGCTVADAIRVMNDAGIGGAAMCPTDQRAHDDLLGQMKAAAADFSGPLWMLPWVTPEGNELAWVREHAADVAGLKIHPSLSRQRISDEGFAPALELAAEREWVILVHCGRWQEMASYKFAVEAAHRYPSARFLLAHGGGDTPPLSTAAAQLVADQQVDNVWFEFSGLREYWVIERNVALLGADRYLMGSDYNLAHPLSYLGAVRGMALSDEQRRKILGENALALYRAPLGG